MSGVIYYMWDRFNVPGTDRERNIRELSELRTNISDQNEKSSCVLERNAAMSWTLGKEKELAAP